MFGLNKQNFIYPKRLYILLRSYNVEKFIKYLAWQATFKLTKRYSLSIKVFHKTINF